MSGDVCTPETHAAAKRDAESFAALTVRLPHLQHVEAYQQTDDGPLWMRNCPTCATTLMIPAARS